MKECPRCGRKVTDDMDDCPVCNYNFGSKEKPKGTEIALDTYRPKVAGYLMIASALSGIVIALVLLFGFWDVQSMLQTSEQVIGNDPQISNQLFSTFLTVCSVMLLFFSALELTGAIFSFKRERWGIAVLGAFLGIFLIGVLFISTILSIIALVFLLMSKDEFI